MTSLAPPRRDFTVLDDRIARALADLRTARLVASRTSNRKNVDLVSRAEANLNALLDYRHAVGGEH